VAEPGANGPRLPTFVLEDLVPPLLNFEFCLSKFKQHSSIGSIFKVNRLMKKIWQNLLFYPIIILKAPLTVSPLSDDVMRGRPLSFVHVVYLLVNECKTKNSQLHHVLKSV